MNILYIGPNESEWAQEHCPGSLAASKWARGFLGGLSKVANVTALTHTYYYPWPKGRKIWSGRDDRLYPKEWKCEVVGYPVLKYIEEWWWPRAYIAKIKGLVRREHFDCVLFYNCCETWQIPIIKAAHELGLKTIPIILDGRNPVNDKWVRLGWAAEHATGFISLSWWMYQNIPLNFPGKLSFHFDGGADGWCGVEPDARPADKPFTLVHTGELDKWRGLDFMVEVVRHYARPGIKFVFCGKNGCRVLTKEFGSNPYVELLGFVSTERMNAVCSEADVLLNVRDPHHPDNILNFPSKLPHYLSFGRPVVSTHLKSLSPAYDEVVRFPTDDSVIAYLAKLDEIKGWCDRRRLEEYNVIKKWFLKNKTWAVMTRKLVSELERER